MITVKTEPGFPKSSATDWSVDISSITLPTEPELPPQSRPPVHSNAPVPQATFKMEPIVVIKQEIVEVPYNQWQPYQLQARRLQTSPARSRPVSRTVGPFQNAFQPQSAVGFPKMVAPTYVKQIRRFPKSRPVSLSHFH